MAAVAASLIPDRQNYPDLRKVLGARHAAGFADAGRNIWCIDRPSPRVPLNLTSHSFGATAGGVEMQARRALLATSGRVLEIVIR